MILVSLLLVSYDISSQTTATLTIWLKRVFMQYETAFKEGDFKARVVCTDMCWATVHAILDAWNRMTIDEYNKMVFEFANERMTVDQVVDKSWIISCAAHTMKRFTNSVKHKLKIEGMFFLFFFLILFIKS
jgi:hypothetical protein